MVLGILYFRSTNDLLCNDLRWSLCEADFIDVYGSTGCWGTAAWIADHGAQLVAFGDPSCTQVRPDVPRPVLEFPKVQFGLVSMGKSTDGVLDRSHLALGSRLAVTCSRTATTTLPLCFLPVRLAPNCLRTHSLEQRLTHSSTTSKPQTLKERNPRSSSHGTTWPSESPDPVCHNLWHS